MNYVYPKLANELLGTKFKIVPGYPGGTPIVLAEYVNQVWDSFAGAEPGADFTRIYPYVAENVDLGTAD